MNAVQRDKKERRVHPRFSADFSVLLTIESGGEKHIIESQANSISVNTIQVKGNSDIMALFQTQNQYPHVCTLNFTLPKDIKEIEVKCHMVTHRRLSQHEYYLAMCFVEFTEDGEERINEALIDMKELGTQSVMEPARQIKQILRPNMMSA